jgi:2-aminoadipate transaminase
MAITEAVPVATTDGRLSRAAGRVRSSAIRDLLALTESAGVLSLAGGLPAVGHVHDPVLAEATARVLADPGAAQYGTTEGWRPLRDWIARRLGGDADPGDVRVTHGSQQALDLVVRALVDPGAPVVVERPTYLGAVQALAAAGARAYAVPVDADGLDTERLAAALAGGLRPALCYLAPTYQNPSGAVMSADRRAHLGALADRYGFVVVDDDPYRELGFSPPPSRLRTWVPPEWSVTLGTFSKVLAPGLRVGWVHGPGWLLEAVTRLKQASDLHTSTVAQRAVADVVGRPGWLDGRARRLTALYRHRVEVLAGALARHAGGRLDFAPPSGGMFLWARLAGGGNAAALLPAAVGHGVAFVPGSAFACDGGPDPHLRLCFATLDDGDLAEAARRLAAALGQLDHRPGG